MKFRPNWLNFGYVLDFIILKKNFHGHKFLISQFWLLRSLKALSLHECFNLNQEFKKRKYLLKFTVFHNFLVFVSSMNLYFYIFLQMSSFQFKIFKNNSIFKIIVNIHSTFIYIRPLIQLLQNVYF